MSLPPNLLPEADRTPGAPNVEPPARLDGAQPPIVIGEPYHYEPQVRPFPAWNIWDVVAILTIALLAIFVCSAVALGIARYSPAYRTMPLSELATNARIVIGAQTAAYPLVFLFMIMLVRNRTESGFGESIHWNWSWVRVPSFLVGGALLALITEAISRFLPIPKSLPMDRYFSDPVSAYLMAVFGTTLAPLLEELFFRGMLYPVLRRSLGLMGAVLLTAGAFASIHSTQLGYAWGPILSIFFVGLVLTVTRERTNSVAASFLMHVGYNCTLFTMLWIASDHFRHLDKIGG